MAVKIANNGGLDPTARMQLMIVCAATKPEKDVLPFFTQCNENKTSIFLFNYLGVRGIRGINAEELWESEVNIGKDGKQKFSFKELASHLKVLRDLGVLREHMVLEDDSLRPHYFWNADGFCLTAEKGIIKKSEINYFWTTREDI